MRSIPTRSPLLAVNDTDRAAFRAVRENCRRHAKSFFFASAFLPPEKRDAAYAIYAFCRMIDDAIDLPNDEQAASPTSLTASCCSTGSLDQTINLFKARLDDIYAHRLELPPIELRDPTHHALHAFDLTVHRYQVPQQYFVDVSEGCRMDLTVTRYATWSALEKYCYRVAGVVGLIMSCVFGVSHSDAGQQAVLMGNAMQLTNILRDVKEDWTRGRLYLPLEDLARFKVTQKHVAEGIVDDSFRALMRFEVERARDLYRRGAEGVVLVGGGRFATDRVGDGGHLRWDPRRDRTTRVRRVREARASHDRPKGTPSRSGLAIVTAEAGRAGARRVLIHSSPIPCQHSRRAILPRCPTRGTR